MTDETSRVGERTVDLSVLLPCHNEARVLAWSISETVNSIRSQFNGSFEILVIDDGSTDNTCALAKAAAEAIPNIRVISLGTNGGKGAALRKAFAETRGRRVCFLDGDLDIHPRHVVPFVRLFERSSADAIIGSKRHPLSRIDYPRQRRILS